MRRVPKPRSARKTPSTEAAEYADHAEYGMDAATRARELFGEHGDAVYRFAVVLLRHREDAEDVVQETFLKLLRHLQRDGDCSNLRAWLFTVAAHAARDRQRRRARWMPWLPQFEGQVDAAALPDEDGRLRTAREMLRRLTVRDRLLLALRAQGLSYREMAVATGIRETSVGRLLARAAARWEGACREATTAETSARANDRQRREVS